MSARIPADHARGVGAWLRKPRAGIQAPETATSSQRGKGIRFVGSTVAVGLGKSIKRMESHPVHFLPAINFYHRVRPCPPGSYARCSGFHSGTSLNSRQYGWRFGCFRWWDFYTRSRRRLIDDCELDTLLWQCCWARGICTPSSSTHGITCDCSMVRVACGFVFARYRIPRMESRK